MRTFAGGPPETWEPGRMAARTGKVNLGRGRSLAARALPRSCRNRLARKNPSAAWPEDRYGGRGMHRKRSKKRPSRFPSVLRCPRPWLVMRTIQRRIIAKILLAQDEF